MTTFIFFVGDDKVNIRTPGSPPLMAGFKAYKRTIDSKGEEAEVLFLMDAGLAVWNLVR